MIIVFNLQTRNNLVLLRPRRVHGFALMAELVSLLVFGLSIFTLSYLSSKSASANSEAVQRIHVSWLANSLMSKMAMNPEDARRQAYRQDNVNCNAQAQTSRLLADLGSLFCTNVIERQQLSQSKPLDVMGDIAWEASCIDGDDADNIACSKGSRFDIVFNWSASGRSRSSGTRTLQYSFIM